MTFDRWIQIFFWHFFLAVDLVSGQSATAPSKSEMSAGLLLYRQEFSRVFSDRLESLQVDSKDGLAIDGRRVVTWFAPNCWLVSRIDPEFKRDRIHVKNSRYGFEILGSLSASSGQLEKVKQIEEYSEREINVFEPPAIKFHLFKLSRLLEYIDIRSLKVSPEGSTVEMMFTLDQDFAENSSKFRIRNGQIILSNDRFFLPIRASMEIKGVSDPSFQKIRISYTYDTSNEVPFLAEEIREFETTPKVVQRFSYSPLDEKISERDFTLAAFGFREPDFLNNRWTIFQVVSLILFSLLIGSAAIWFWKKNARSQ